MRTEDGKLVRKCLNGDTAAFGSLVDKYKASIYALAYSKLRNFHDAEDVTQEAFIKAYRKLHTLRRWDNFLAWIYAITANLCKDWIRSQAKRPDREFAADQEPGILENPATNLYRDKLARESLHEALESLPKIYYQVLTLYYLGGMSTKEIARFLGTSPNGVSQRLKKARNGLREEMIAMMNTTYERQKLPISFTFRIMDMVKLIKIRPLPRTQLLPWGMSLVAGLIIAVLSYTSSLISADPVFISSVIPTGGQIASAQHSGVYSSQSNAYDQKVELLDYSDISLDLVAISDAPAPLGNPGHRQSTQPAELLASATTLEPASETDEKIAISGKVMRDNAPVPNAQVYLYDRYLRKKQAEVATTQADGAFSIETPKLDGGNIWAPLDAVAHHPLHSFGWANIPAWGNGEVIIELHPPITMTGKVVDMAGKPVEAADVEISLITFPRPGVPGGGFGNRIYGSGFPTPIVKTDADGRFTIPNLPDGAKARIFITGQGYARERPFVSIETTELLFQLKPEGSLEGHVTFEETGEPARGAKVYIEGVDPADGWAESQTDEAGYYILKNLAVGSYNVRLKDIPFDQVFTTREYIKVLEGEVTRDVDLQFIEGELITGRVTDRNTNEPIKDHGVMVARQGVAVSSSQTDENGFYQLRAAPGNIMVFTYIPRSYQDTGQINKEVHVAKGKTISGIDFQFGTSSSISLSGRTIALDGEPVGGAAITDRAEFYNQYAVSDENGNFTISGLRPDQKLSVRAEQAQLQLRGYADLAAQLGAEVEILMDRYEITSVSGRVVNKEGDPIPAADVWLSIHDRETPGRSMMTPAGSTNAMGEYRVTGLVIGDEYSIRSSSVDYREAYTKGFMAKADMPPLEDIILLPHGSFFLEGVIKDTDGNPVVNAMVRSRSELHDVVQTDENGYYRVDGLSFAVTPRLSIDHPEYGLNEFWYVPTNQTQNFVLAVADGYLNGTVVDKDGNPVNDAIVRAGIIPEFAKTGHFNLGVRTNGQGEFQLKNLLVNETESVSIRKAGISRTFKDIEMNQDGVVLVLEESSEPEEPSKQPTAEEIARSKYMEKQWARREKIPGQPAPELDVAQWLHGRPITLAELRGKIVLLHFWSERDVVGLKAAQIMNTMRFVSAMQNIYGKDGLVCIGIHEFTGQIDELEKLLTEKKVDYPTAIDKELSIPGARGVTSDKYAVFSSLSFILIGKNGVIDSQPSPYNLEEKIRELVPD